MTSENEEGRFKRQLILINCCSLFRRNVSKTVKQKRLPDGSSGHDLLKHAAQTLGSGNIKEAVKLPDGEDLNEWIAVNSKYMCMYMYERFMSWAVPPLSLSLSLSL